MRVGNGWLIVFLVIVAGLVAAIWPRSADFARNSAPVAVANGLAATATGQPTDPPRTTATEPGLIPCPEPPPATTPIDALSGIAARCVGQSARVDLGAALAGGDTLINLWASWCGPCRSEIPILDTYSREPGAVRVVGINVEDDPDSAVALLHELRVRYPSFAAADTVRAALQAPQVLPLSYLLTARGETRQITTPAVFTDPAQVRSALAQASR